MASLISASEYLSRADVVTVAKLCNRGTPNANPQTPVKLPTAAELLTNAVLAARLKDASGMLLGVCRQGDKYTESDLANLTGNAQGALYHLLTQLVDCLLWEGRAMGSGDIPQPVYYDRVFAELERLRNGERMF